jgi:hypothetical protein
MGNNPKPAQEANIVTLEMPGLKILNGSSTIVTKMFCGPPQYFQENSQILASISLLPLPPTTFRVHYSMSSNTLTSHSL